MKSRTTVACLLLLIGACAEAPREEQASTEPAMPARGPLEGVWRISEVTITGGPDAGTVTAPQPSLYIFARQHYSVMRVDGDEARPLWPEGLTRSALTDARVRATFLPFVGNAGTYQVQGTRVTVRPIVALSPNFMSGGSDVFEYQVEGDRLVLTDTTVVEPVTEVRWTLARLE